MSPALFHRGGITWAIVGGVVLALIVVWYVPKVQVNGLPGNTFNAENEARRTLVQLLGGLALLAGLWLTLRRVKASERTAESALDGQVTERFSRAIEHLSSDRLPMRLGGIYALERIGRDSKIDHWTVMEVLSALVRTESPRDDSKPGPVVGSVAQVALSVIARRDASCDGAHHLDLRGTNLGLAELPGAKLAGADLRLADLSGSCLAGADLKGSELTWAVLASVKGENASLDSARMWGTRLTGARLDGASLRQVDLSGTVLRDASLRNADLEHAVVAQLTESGLAYQWWVDIEGADLSFANLRRVVHWRGVTKWRNTNIFGVRNAPEGLVEWATYCGAVAVEDEREWWEAKMTGGRAPDGEGGRDTGGPPKATGLP